MCIKKQIRNALMYRVRGIFKGKKEKAAISSHDVALATSAGRASALD